MMASWKPKHVVKHYLKLETYFINCCVVTVFNKEKFLIVSINFYVGLKNLLKKHFATSRLYDVMQ
jgi:hypothetical protein